MDDILFSVLIVNYNGQRHLPACLAALTRQSFPRHRYEIVLVDNASTDGSLGFVRDQFPQVRVVPLVGNSGFTGGNNAGMPYLHGRFVVLLNNDTIPDPHWLSELAAETQAGQTAASKLVFAGEPATLNSGGLQLLRDGRGFDRGFRTPDEGQCETTRFAFAACGAALVVDREATGEVLFPPRYFMYYEDLDRAWSDWLAGRGLAFVPRSLVRHVHGGSAGDESPLFRFYVERNRTLTSIRNGDAFLAVVAVLGQLARFGRSLIRTFTRGRRRGLVVAEGQALLSLLMHLPAAVVSRYLHRQRRPANAERSFPEASRCAS